MAFDTTVFYTDSSTDEVHKQPVVLAPGEINADATSLVLIGEGAIHYGKHINENFIALLENFCSPVEPANPTRGQIWFDPSLNIIRICTNVTTDVDGDTTTQWSVVGGIHSGSTPPMSTSGLWYDTTVEQLKRFDIGTGTWVSIARDYVAKTGDTLSGSLVFSSGQSGISGTASGFTNTISPTTPRGPVVIGGKHAGIIINAASTSATGAELVIGRNSTDLDVALVGNNRLVVVSDSGLVSVLRNNVSMNGNKITDLGLGTLSSDAVTCGQLNDAIAPLNTSINDLYSTITGAGADVNNKVSKTGDTMSGALSVNNTLYVQQGASFGSTVGASGTISSTTGFSTGGTLTVSGSSTLGSATVSTLSVSGVTTLSGALNTGSTARFTGAVTAVNSISVGTTLSVTSGASIGGTLTVSGAVTANSTLGVGSNATISGTLGVVGGATFNSTIAVGSDVTAYGSMYIAGLITMNQSAAAITQSTHVVTKEYADTKLPLSGGTITGRVVISKSGQTGGWDAQSLELRAGDTSSPGISFHVPNVSAIILRHDSGTGGLSIVDASGSAYAGLAVGSLSVSSSSWYALPPALTGPVSSITANEHFVTKQYLDNRLTDYYTKSQVDALSAGYTITSGTTAAVGYTNTRGQFSTSSNYFDVFPPQGKSMSNLIAFIPSIAYIYFAGEVDDNDALRCSWSAESDRVRVFVQNTEQRSTPAGNWLAVWS